MVRLASNFDRLSRLTRSSGRLSAKWLWLFAAVILTNNCVLCDESNAEEVKEKIDDFVYETPDTAQESGLYFFEHFDNPAAFKKRWVKSETKKEGVDDDIAKYDGQFEIEQLENDALKNDLGLVLKSKAKHFGLSAKLKQPFVFSNSPLVVQYEVNFQAGQECGGAYLKLLSYSQDKTALDLKNFNDKTPYTIMFGPDKCGNDAKLHFIFRHKNPINGTITEKHCKKPKERIDDVFTDKKPHLFTLILLADNTFQILVDHIVVNEGSLLTDFTPPVNPPEEIDDPKDFKPADWDERESIPDDTAVKPADWDEDAPQYIIDPAATKPAGWLDDEPLNIPDPSAERPEDWDDDIDGEWEPPLINNPACEEAPGCGQWNPPEIINPEYKGTWRPPLVDNPNYQGKWSPRRIPNPDYFEDKDPFKMTTFFAVGLELWTMSNQIYFDNILITHDRDLARELAAKTFDLKRKKIDKVADSVFTMLTNYTAEYPWLWAVYIVVIALPIVIIVALCCGSSSTKEKEDAGLYKKTDTFTPDDPVKEDDAAAGNEEPHDEGEEDDNSASSNSQAAIAEQTEIKQSSKKDESKTSDKEDEENGDDEEKTGPSDGAGDAPPSPRKRRSRKD